MPEDPALPGWRVVKRKSSGRSWKIFYGPNGERCDTRVAAVRQQALLDANGGADTDQTWNQGFQAGYDAGYAAARRKYKKQ